MVTVHHTGMLLVALSSEVDVTAFLLGCKFHTYDHLKNIVLLLGVPILCLMVVIHERIESCVQHELCALCTM